MKRVKRSLLLFVLFCMLLCTSALAKPSNKTVMNLYKEFLASGKIYTFKKNISFKVDSNKKYKQKVNDTIHLSKCSFNVADIDKNGIKELIVKPIYPYDRFMWHYVFTVKSGKVAPCGCGYMRQDESPTMYYLKSKKALLYDYGTAGTDSIYIYYLKNGKIKKVDAYYRYTDWDKNKDICFKNGKKIKFSKYKKEAWNLKTTRIDLYSNTEKNRNTVLK